MPSSFFIVKSQPSRWFFLLSVRTWRVPQGRATAQTVRDFNYAQVRGADYDD